MEGFSKLNLAGCTVFTTSSVRSRYTILVLIYIFGAVSISSRAHANQLDSDIRLFTVLAAINLAGYDSGLNATADTSLRRTIRADLSNFHGSSKQRLRDFYDQHKLSDPSSTLAQYVSYALMSDGPPSFKLTASLPTELPPDVRRIRGFGSILAEFYNQAPIEHLWNKYQGYFDREIARYQEPLIGSLFEAAGYVRISPTSREVQSFQVIFDLLGGSNQLNIRSYRGNVYVVVHPSKRLYVDEIRHAFLLHLLDRLAIRNSNHIREKSILSRFAMFAPALHETYKANFQLLVSKSLVKAIEVRLARLTRTERALQITQNLREGYILTPYFFDALELYENQSADMKIYYSELIEGIDLQHEARRLQSVEFAETAATRTNPIVAQPKNSEADTLLRQGELLLADRKPLQAQKKFKLALTKEGGSKPDITYGLARASLAEGDADSAARFFEQTLNSFPDPHVEAMSHIYLGRIADVMGARKEAIERYKFGLAVPNIPDGVRELATAGLMQPFGATNTSPTPEPDDADTYDDEAAAWGDEDDWDEEEE